MRVTRRAALGLLAAAAAEVGGPIAGARGAPAGLRLRAIGVDTSRIADLGNPSGAEAVRRALERQLRSSFADLIAPADRGGATLSVRISGFTLASYVGTRSYGGRSGEVNNDYLEGVATATSGGATVSETPLLVSLDASYSGAWYLPDIDRLRTDSIAHQFAYWLRREMGV